MRRAPHRWPPRVRDASGCLVGGISECMHCGLARDAKKFPYRYLVEGRWVSVDSAPSCAEAKEAKARVESGRAAFPTRARLLLIESRLHEVLAMVEAAIASGGEE